MNVLEKIKYRVWLWVNFNRIESKFDILLDKEFKVNISNLSTATYRLDIILSVKEKDFSEIVYTDGIDELLCKTEEAKGRLRINKKQYGLVNRI